MMWSTFRRRLVALAQTSRQQAWSAKPVSKTVCETVRENRRENGCAFGRSTASPPAGTRCSWAPCRRWRRRQASPNVGGLPRHSRRAASHHKSFENGRAVGPGGIKLPGALAPLCKGINTPIPSGWGQIPSGGCVRSPPSSTGHHWCHSTLLRWQRQPEPGGPPAYPTQLCQGAHGRDRMP